MPGTSACFFFFFSKRGKYDNLIGRTVSPLGIMGRNKETKIKYIFTRAYSHDKASVPVDSLRHGFAHTPLAGECFRHFFYT